jgi:hypothetical protein
MQSGGWDGTERRKISGISDEDVRDIADLAADIVEERFFARVGRALWEKLLWVAGAVLVAGFAWLHGAGKISIGG